MLTAEVELDTLRTTTGASAPLTSTETEPDKNRKQLLAQPLQAKTVVTDNFLEENIEGENFMDLYMGLLAEAMGPAFQRFGIFADTSVSTVSGEGTAYKTTENGQRVTRLRSLQPYQDALPQIICIRRHGL